MLTLRLYARKSEIKKKTLRCSLECVDEYIVIKKSLVFVDLERSYIYQEGLKIPLQFIRDLWYFLLIWQKPSSTNGSLIKAK